MKRIVSSGFVGSLINMLQKNDGTLYKNYGRSRVPIPSVVTVHRLHMKGVEREQGRILSLHLAGYVSRVSQGGKHICKS